MQEGTGDQRKGERCVFYCCNVKIMEAKCLSDRPRSCANKLDKSEYVFETLSFLKCILIFCLRVVHFAGPWQRSS